MITQRCTRPAQEPQGKERKKENREKDSYISVMNCILSGEIQGRHETHIKNKSNNPRRQNKQ